MPVGGPCFRRALVRLLLRLRILLAPLFTRLPKPSTCGFLAPFRSAIGGRWTYKHKNGGKLTRIDYVLLPVEWRPATVNTWTDCAIHAGQVVIDHIASVLDVTAQVIASSCKRRGMRRRPKIDERALLRSESRGLVDSIMAAAPKVPWHVSAHADAAILSGYLQDQLCKAFPCPSKGSGHSFLTEATSALRSSVSNARNRFARLNTQVRHQLLQAAFQSWKRRDGEPSCSGLHVRHARDRLMLLPP